MPSARPPRPSRPATTAKPAAKPEPEAVDAANLHIVHYPASVLKKKATHIPASDDTTKAVVRRMIELMHKAEGIGLAAPQVGLSWRLFVVHVPEDAEDDRLVNSDPPGATARPQVYINPKITKFEGPVEPFEEGCLSLPGIRGEVLRPPHITVTATDEHGKAFTHKAGGLLARCIQHELDHLDGVLIIDKMLMADRTKNKKKIRALEEP